MTPHSLMGYTANLHSKYNAQTDGLALDISARKPKE